jgi:hypothetical protein
MVARQMGAFLTRGEIVNAVNPEAARRQPGG